VHTNLNYGEIFVDFWQSHGVDVVYQPTCLQPSPTNNGRWWVKFPEVTWNDRTVVIMHCQDFLNVTDHCRELDIIERHFGDKSSRVIVVVWNIGLEKIYSGPLNLCYFPTHTFEIIQNLKQIQDSWFPATLNDDRSTKFLSLNGSIRPHRRALIQQLEIFPSKIISLGDEISLPQWPYSTYRGTENEDNYLRLLPFYQQCDINVVSETQFWFAPGIITEKTLFALLSRQVPIVIGYQGIVRDLENLGFDIFSDVVDVAYDQLPNDQRISAAIESNRGILTNGITRADLVSRLDANQQRAMSWPASMQQNYVHQCHEILDYMRRQTSLPV
jgi:hypothetical protein